VKPLTIVLPDLESTGPILDVQLGNSPTGQRALRQHGQAVPAPVSVRALIDTGSGGTGDSSPRGKGLSQNYWTRRCTTADN